MGGTQFNPHRGCDEEGEKTIMPSLSMLIIFLLFPTFPRHPIISPKGDRSASIPGFPFLGLSSHLLGPQIGEATDKSDLLPLVIEPLSVSWTHGLTKDILQAHLELGVTMRLSSS